jgi:hypothetical protein
MLFAPSFYGKYILCKITFFFSRTTTEGMAVPYPVAPTVSPVSTGRLTFALLLS